MSNKPFALFALAIATVMILAVACAGDAEPAAPKAQAKPAAAQQPAAAAAAADPSAPSAVKGTSKKTASTSSSATKAPSAAAQAQFDRFPDDGMPQYGGVLRMGGSEPRTLNFLDNTTSSTGKIANMIYDELVRWDWWADYAGEPQKPDVGLSHKWSVNDDGTVWTFQLRKNVNWHDGTPFTCADVKATYDFYINPGDAGPPGSSYVKPFVEETKCTDDHTVELHLNGPAGSLLLNLAYHWATIVPKHKLDLSVDNKWFNNHALGTGPFMWMPDEYEPDIRFKVTRSDTYWEEGLPYLDGVETFVMSTTASTLAAFETKRIDTTSGGSPTQQAGMIERNPELRVVKRAAGGHSYILWNVRKPPFDDPKVRQAMYLWIDRPPFLEKAAAGRGYIKDWLNPDWNGGYGTSAEDLVKNNPAYALDKTAARKKSLELLAEAGYGDPSSTPVNVVARYTSGNGLKGNILLTSQLKEMGWDVTLNSMDKLAGVRALRAGEYSAAYYGGNAGLPSPDATLNRYMGAKGQRNYTGYSDPIFNKLVEEYNFTSDRAKREKTLAELDQHLQYGPDGNGSTYSMHVMVWGKTEAMEWPYMHGYDWTLGCCGQRYYHVWLESNAPGRN